MMQVATDCICGTIRSSLALQACFSQCWLLVRYSDASAVNPGVCKVRSSFCLEKGSLASVRDQGPWQSARSIVKARHARQLLPLLGPRLAMASARKSFITAPSFKYTPWCRNHPAQRGVKRRLSSSLRGHSAPRAPPTLDEGRSQYEKQKAAALEEARRVVRRPDTGLSCPFVLRSVRS
jgi:hypothetical protein